MTTLLKHPTTFDPLNLDHLFPMTPEREAFWRKEFATDNEGKREEMLASLREAVEIAENRAAARPHSDVSLYETPSNNHGCCGFRVELAIIDGRTARVVNGSSCSSCWQVGHDNADSPIDIGTIVRLPDWCDSWDEASAPHGRSHNELVNDSDEHPQSDCSFVRPGELIR